MQPENTQQRADNSLARQNTHPHGKQINRPKFERGRNNRQPENHPAPPTACPQAVRRLKIPRQLQVGHLCPTDRVLQKFQPTKGSLKTNAHVFRLPPIRIPSTTSNKALPTHQQSRLATKRACFNTQPPESGCLKCATSACAAAWFQHTAARRRLEKSCLRNVP